MVNQTFLTIVKFPVKPRTIALKTTPHLPKLSIKLELKPEHHNAAFYENNQHEEDEEEDGIAEDEADGDGSTSHISEQSTSQSDQFGSMGSSAGAVTLVTPTGSASTATSSSSSSASGNSNNKTMVKKSSISKSPAPPTVGRKATSYIAVST